MAVGPSAETISLQLDQRHQTCRPFRDITDCGKSTNLVPAGSKDLGKVERQDRVEALVGDQHVLVLDIQRDPAWHAQDSVRASDGPFGGNVAVVVNAPDADGLTFVTAYTVSV